MTKATGAPVETGLENFEEAILKLSVADRVKLIHWISESVVENVELPEREEESTVKNTTVAESASEVWPLADIRFAEDMSGKTPWYEGIPEPKDLTEEEWKAKVYEVSGSWADHPMSAEELIEDIYSSRALLHESALIGRLLS